MTRAGPNWVKWRPCSGDGLAVPAEAGQIELTGQLAERCDPVPIQYPAAAHVHVEAGFRNSHRQRDLGFPGRAEQGQGLESGHCRAMIAGVQQDAVGNCDECVRGAGVEPHQRALLRASPMQGRAAATVGRRGLDRQDLRLNAARGEAGADDIRFPLRHEAVPRVLQRAAAAAFEMRAGRGDAVGGGRDDRAVVQDLARQCARPDGAGLVHAPRRAGSAARSFRRVG